MRGRVVMRSAVLWLCVAASVWSGWTTTSESAAQTPQPKAEAKAKPAAKAKSESQAKPAGNGKPEAKAKAAKPAASALAWPPTLRGGGTTASVTSDEFLRRAESLAAEVVMAKTAPRVDFAFYPGQTYPGNPWSNWGQGSCAEGKYYSAIGDHLAPQGNAFVYEYDPRAKAFRVLTDVRAVLQLPDGHYSPGKIHSRVEQGSDGWLYFTTHRGSTRVTTDEHHFQGDWILRADPRTGKSEIVAHGPVPKHCLPTGLLDAQRLIYYASTAPGKEDGQDGVHFLAYDLRGRKVLYDGPNGPSRAMILSRSTGRVYFAPGASSANVVRFDASMPAAPTAIPGEFSLRAVTNETADGKIFCCSYGSRERGTEMFEFDVKTERVMSLGPAAVGVNQYVAALAVDPRGRYVYYVPGAHGGSEQDGSAVVQFDTQRRQRKVIASLHPYFAEHHGCTLKGTYSVALDEQGEHLFVTWNVSREGKVWDSCALTVIQIPASERE